MAVLFAFKRRRRMPLFRPALPSRPIRADHGWCDAPRHPAYNRPVRLPFAASAERMRRDDHLYDAVVVLDWNVRRRARELGSAIFLHLAADNSLPPTAGCIAVRPRDMARLSPLLLPGTRLVVRR